MATKEELLAEAYRRGLLPPDRKAAYEEAMRRGLVPKVRVGPKRGERRGAAEETSGFMANLNRGLLIGDEFAAGLATAADLVTGKVKPRGGKSPLSMEGAYGGLTDRFQRNMRVQRGIEDDFRARRPVVAGLAQGAGTSATLVVPGGAVARAPNLLAGMARGATVAGGQGYVSGLLDRGTGTERKKKATTNALVAAPIGAALPLVGAAVPLVANALRPSAAKAIDPNVALLAREGVQMTHGQIRGGAVKALEDAATSTPILGDAIQRARRASMESFTRAPVNRGLAAIDDALPPGVTGNEAIAYGQQRFSQGYEDLLPTAGVKADQEFAAEIGETLGSITQTLRPESRAQLQSIIASRVQSRLGPDGAMTGEVYKRIQSELSNEISRFSSSTDPDARAVAEALKAVGAGLRSAAARQNPEFAKSLAALDRGYAQQTRAEVAAARTGAEGGVFTPAQYDSAVRAGNDTVRKRGYAAGDALGQDLADAGRAVLPNAIPDSGTARRGMVGLVLGGGATAAGGLPGLLASAGGLAAASRLYTPRAIELANQALNRRLSEQEGRALLSELAEIAATNPRSRELYQAVADQLSRGAGAATNAATQQPNALAAAPR